MRRRKRRAGPPVSPGRFVAITACALSMPVMIHLFSSYGSSLRKLGQNTAIFSAALNMPDSGLSLARERFEEELYDSGTPDGHYPAPPAAREESAGERPEGEGGEPAPVSEEVPDEDNTTLPSPVKIPKQYTGTLIEENFSVSGDSYVRFGAGYIKNETSHEDGDVEELLETPMSIQLEDTAEPQVLIVHTHATESFEKYDSSTYDTRNTWRTTDNNSNMVAVGNAMQEVLEANGVGVIHDSTQHDYPSYNGSYERSAVTISDYLEEYPSIKIVLDLHRDAILREDDSIVKPVGKIDGKKAAQIMIIAACDDGTMDIPNWEENLRFAALFQDYMEMNYPQLTRPVYFCYRKYNMDLTTGSLLLEFGSNANTLEEAMYSAQLAGEALSQLIRDNIDNGIGEAAEAAPTDSQAEEDSGETASGEDESAAPEEPGGDLDIELFDGE